MATEILKRDILDTVFDHLETTSKWLYDRDLIKNWFSIISWSALTAAVFALGKESNSLLLYAIATVSLILTFFYGWHTLFSVIEEIAKSKYKRSVYLLAILLGCVGPGILIGYLFQTITILLHKSS